MRSYSFFRFTLPFVSLSVALTACDSGSDSDPAPAPEPLVANLGLAAHRLYGQGDLRLVAASEADQGRDFDGDGDQTGFVLHLFDLASEALVNTGLALPPRFQRDEVPPLIGCNDALGVFQISEAETGFDLDQDGVPNEVTTWTFNRRTGALRSLPFVLYQLVLGDDVAAFLAEDGSGGALLVFDGRDDSLTTRAIDPSGVLGARREIVAFSRSEAGAFDLNADGDTSDVTILHLYDADSRRITNTSFGVVQAIVRFSRGFAGLNVAEAEHGGLDLNGDGDAEDQVFVAVDGKTGLTRIPGFSGAELADLFEQAPLGFLLSLSEEDGDRNGDGDTFDRIAALYDPVADRLYDTGLAGGFLPPAQTGRWIGVMVREADQGQTDLDGDGQFFSEVPHVFDTLTGQSFNLGFSGFWIGAFEDQFLAVGQTDRGVPELRVWDASARRLHRTGVDARNVLGTADGRALITVRELVEDLNGDGDRSDFVLALYDAHRGTVRSLRLATSVFQGVLGPNGHAAVLVSETAQGADLNGDGDLDDQVLHQVRIDGP